MSRNSRWGCCLGGCLLALFAFIAGLFSNNNDKEKRGLW